LRVEFQRLSGEPLLDAVSDVKIIGGPSNAAPEFSSDTYTLEEATADQAYNGNVAGNASDADGDVLTYSKVSGAGWLNVASDGSLSGTPNPGYIGSNSATVMVNDGNGGTDTAVFNIYVNDAAASGTLIDDSFENFNSTGWVTDWQLNTARPYTGDNSIKGLPSTNDLVSPTIDTSALSSMTLSFMYRTQAIDPADDVVLQLWNGNSYITVDEIGDVADRTWLQYNRSISSSQYPQFFRSDFKFKIESSGLSTGESIWVDDVLLTAE
jgi:uncharacterized protein YlzI (FlbEa/FlbD family)